MKKGFTLIELLAVIVVLAIVSLIVFPEVTRIIQNSKQKSYDTQINNLIEAARRAAIKNTLLLPIEQDGSKSCISLNYLLNNGEIDTDQIYDPRNSSVKLTGTIVVTYNSQYKQFIYEYKDRCE